MGELLKYLYSNFTRNFCFTANSEDPDQLSLSVGSGMGLRCL